VDHFSAKHKLTWCCLQCCMIGASNSMVTMKLIEGSNQMDYPETLFGTDFPYGLFVWQDSKCPCALNVTPSKSSLTQISVSSN
jgi:hypothetical protein